MLRDGDRSAVEFELDDLISSVLYTEKAHFAHERLARAVQFALGLISTVSGSMTALVASRGGSENVIIVIALIATGCSAVLTFVRPGKSAEAHAKSARSLGELRVRMRQYRELALRKSGLNYSDACEALAGFAGEKAEIDAVAESISEWLYKRVSNRLSKKR